MENAEVVHVPASAGKSWLKQPGECHDSNGVPIYPGDLLRTFHFTGPRRRKWYLYHVAVYERLVRNGITYLYFTEPNGEEARRCTWKPEDDER